MSTEYNTEQQLITGILNHGVDVLEFAQTSENLEKYISRISEEKLNYPVPKLKIDKQWFMPKEYKNLDIEEFLINQCPKENYERLMIELQEYKNRDLLDLLRQMKYIVDVLKEKNIIWGVGRGSSVASYILYLLGVHKVDSIKYNLPIEEFFKGGEK